MAAWAIADRLGHRRMLLEIDGDNLRSQSAAWKQFPSARVLLLAGASEPEAALVLEVAEPPLRRPPRPPTESIFAHVTELVAEA